MRDDEKQVIYEKYVQSWDKIRAKCVRQGVELEKPRGPRLFWDIIFSQFKVWKQSKPHPCPHCDEYEPRKAQLIGLLTKLKQKGLTKDERQLIRDEIRVVLRVLKATRLHRRRDGHQRSWTQEKRKSLRVGELLVWFDYGSWYKKQGKTNDLVFVLEWVEEVDGERVLERHYIDYVCDNEDHDPLVRAKGNQGASNNAHDYNFSSQCLYHLVTKNGFYS